MHTRTLVPTMALLVGGCLLLAATARGQEAASLDELLDLRVSTASKYEQLARRAPASVTVVTAEEIERHGYRTLADVLAAVPGFYLSYDRNYHFVGVRGFSRPTDYNNRLLLLVDGHTVNENVFGSMGAGPDMGVDLRAVERIEIVRGPGAALYGTGAMLAVVNVILKQGSGIDGTRLELGVGSYGERRLAVQAGAALARGLDLMASAYAVDSEGADLYFSEYAAEGGLARDLDGAQSHGAVVRARYRDLSLLALTNTSDKSIPTASFGMVFGDPDARTGDRRAFVELKAEHELSPRLALVARGYADHYRYDGTYALPEGTWFESARSTSWGGELQARWDPRVHHRLTAGAEYRRNLRADYRIWDAEAVLFVGDFPFDLVSAYAQEEYQATDDLAFVLGVRHDRYSTVGDSTSPRAALVWTPGTASTVKLLFGRAFRAPNIYETRYEAVSAGYKSNLRLGPERLVTGELVWERRWRAGLFSALSLYETHFEDLVDQVVDPGDGLLQFRNGGRAQARGAELTVKARLRGGAHLHGGLVYQDAEDEISGAELTNVPLRSLKLGIALPLAAGVHAAGELIYESGRLTVQATRTDPYWLANLTLSYEPQRLPLVLTLRLRNLRDAVYATPGGFEHRQAAITQDGRTWSANLGWRF